MIEQSELENVYSEKCKLFVSSAWHRLELYVFWRFIYGEFEAGEILNSLEAGMILVYDSARVFKLTNRLRGLSLDHGVSPVNFCL